MLYTDILIIPVFLLFQLRICTIIDCIYCNCFQMSNHGANVGSNEAQYIKNDNSFFKQF